MSALRQRPEPAAASPQGACGGRAATLQSLESDAQWGATAESLSQSAPSRLCGQWEVLSATRPPESAERRLELTLPTPVPMPGLRTRSAGRGPRGAEVLSLAGRRGWILGYWTGAEAEYGGSSPSPACFGLLLLRAEGSPPSPCIPGHRRVRLPNCRSTPSWFRRQESPETAAPPARQVGHTYWTGQISLGLVKYL